MTVKCLINILLHKGIEMKTTNKSLSVFRLSAVSIVSALILAACGGGGSTPNTPVAQTCANGALDYPTCTPAVTPADLQLTVPAPPYAAGSEDLKAFDYLNDWRSSQGLGKLAYSPEMTKSAQAHSNYVALNGDTDPNFSFHVENSTRSGFTGVNVIDRVRYAGYATNGWVSEVAAAGNNQTAAVQRLIDTVYHRAVLMSQSARDVGGYWTASPTTQVGSEIINIGYKTPQRNASDFTMFYPKTGQTNVALSMCNESPKPFPEVVDGTGCTAIGYPVSFSAAEGQTLTVTSFTITENGATAALSAWLMTKTNDTNGILGSHESFLTVKGAMKPLTTYNVSFVGTANGRNVSAKWSFTTAAS